ncbi:MAG TPA: carboxypeptidase regulatory-like domain-containing protein [Polyangia bacterium]
MGTGTDAKVAPNEPWRPHASLVAPLGSAAGSLEGTVRQSDGKPVEGAIVLATAPTQAPFETLTDAMGKFHIGNLSAGRYVLTAVKTGVGVARSDGLDVKGASAVQNLTIVIVAAKAGLAGRVLDPGGGGIPGARVLADAIDNSRASVFATMADENGHYQLPLPPGLYRFEARADGYATGRFGMNLHLPTQRDFRLYPGSRISGRVRDRSGEPLPGAEVSIVNTHSLEPGMVSRTVICNDAGAFAFKNIDPSTYRLIAHAGPFVAQHPRPLVVGLTQDLSVEVVLDRGRTISGTVAMQNGAPVADAVVTVPFGPVEFMREGQPGTRTTTDAQGRFEVVGLPPIDDLDVIANAPAGKAQRRLRLTMADQRDLRLVLEPQGEVTGTVLDRERRPAANARVIAAIGEPRGPWSRVTHTDSAGAFRITGLATGPLVVSAIHEDGLGEIALGYLERGVAKHVEIVLGAGSDVEGTVRKGDGRKAAGVQVFAFAGGWNRNAPAWGQPTAATLTGTDGAYRFNALPAGEVLLRAANPGDDPFLGLFGRNAQKVHAIVVLGRGETKTGVDLRLARNDLTIAGRVIDADGRPIHGAILNALVDGEGDAVGRARTISQTDGQFVIEGLSQADHAIVVAHPEYPEVRREHVPAGTQGLELRLERQASLQGVVLGFDGRPAPLYAIVARPMLSNDPTEAELRKHWVGPGFRQDVLAQLDGVFDLGPLPPGRYEVVAHLPNQLVGTLGPINLHAGERRRDLRLLSRFGVSLRGRVVDSETGQPILTARVEGRGTARGSLAANVDSTGSFVVAGFPPGQVVDFAVLSLGGDYLTESLHRTLSLSESTVDLGSIRLFAGPGQKLTFSGQAATGLWFHTLDGQSMVYAVRPGSLAANAGIRRGDRVFAVNDVDVRDASSSVIEGLVATSGTTIKLTISSSGVLRTVVLQRPDSKLP